MDCHVAGAPRNDGQGMDCHVATRLAMTMQVGYSVLDMVRAFELASGKPVPYKVAPRRAGDIAACYADPAQALALLGWRAERGLDAMCADAWRWQSRESWIATSLHSSQ